MQAPGTTDAVGDWQAAHVGSPQRIVRQLRGPKAPASAELAVSFRKPLSSTISEGPPPSLVFRLHECLVKNPVTCARRTLRVSSLTVAKTCPLTGLASGRFQSHDSRRRARPLVVLGTKRQEKEYSLELCADAAAQPCEPSPAPMLPGSSQCAP